VATGDWTIAATPIPPDTTMLPEAPPGIAEPAKASLAARAASAEEEAIASAAARDWTIAPTPIPPDTTDAELVALWLHGKSPHTIRAYGDDVAAFRRFTGKPLRATYLSDLQRYADSLVARTPDESPTVAIHDTEYDARAARFARAAGHCECPGFGCGVPTHIREASSSGIGYVERGCGAPVTDSGLNSDNTRVVLMHSYDDPKDDANLRIYCEACGKEHDRAMSL
jgi:hypothetical protein